MYEKKYTNYFLNRKIINNIFSIEKNKQVTLWQTCGKSDISVNLFAASLIF